MIHFQDSFSRFIDYTSKIKENGWKWQKLKKVIALFSGKCHLKTGSSCNLQNGLLLTTAYDFLFHIMYRSKPSRFGQNCNDAIFSIFVICMGFWKISLECVWAMTFFRENISLQCVWDMTFFRVNCMGHRFILEFFMGRDFFWAKKKIPYNIPRSPILMSKMFQFSNFFSQYLQWRAKVLLPLLFYINGIGRVFADFSSSLK